MNIVFYELVCYERDLLWTGLLWTWSVINGSVMNGSVMNVVCFEWSVLSGLLWAGLFWMVTMTEILLSMCPSVFSWRLLGCGSSSAGFLLPRLEKGIVWPIPRWTHPARLAVVALMMTVLVSISRNAATGRATWRHLSSSPTDVDSLKESRPACFYPIVVQEKEGCQHLPTSISFFQAVNIFLSGCQQLQTDVNSLKESRLACFHLLWTPRGKDPQTFWGCNCSFWSLNYVPVLLLTSF